MDARQLTYFLGIVDTGSFSKAAQQLLIAQPSLSQTIKALEKSLGVELFTRTGRGAELTSAGQALVGPARQVLRDLEAAQQSVSGIRDLTTGTVDVITMPSPGIEPFSTLVQDFTNRHPGIKISTQSAFTHRDIVEAVSSGACEVGIMGSSHQPYTADLAVIQLPAQPLILITPPGKGLNSTQVTLKDFAGLDFVISHRGSLMRQVVDNAIADGVTARVRVEVAHRTSILPLVQAGVGYSILPAAWQDLAIRSGCSVHTIKDVPPLQNFAVHKTQGLTPGAQEFVHSIKRLAQKDSPQKI